MSPPDVVTYGLAGLGFSFALSVLKSAVCAPKLLDAEAQSEIARQASSITQLEAKLKRSVEDEYHFQKAQEELSELDEDVRAVILVMCSKGEIVNGNYPRISNLTNDRIHQILTDVEKLSFIHHYDTDQADGPRKAWAIVQAYRKAVGEILYPSNSSIAQR